ncbi:MAG: cadherin-like beta sandwich domain-containing protein [Coriobacteriia bacterium]|nr:cadherin-like beta sandwich domain-containing protein [Coriobacteriia bacterium]
MKNWSQIVTRVVLALILSFCTILPAESFALSSGAPYLDQLSAEGVTLQPVFRPTTLYYSASADEQTTKLALHAIPQDPSTSVEIKGNQDLHPGINTIYIVLTSPENTTQTYTITVNKAGTVSTGSATLKSLSIGTWELSPVFSAGITSYSTDVDQNTDHLTIEAIPENPRAQVTISGDTHLRTGANQISIEVVSKDSSSTKTYTITVNKPPVSPKNLTPQGNLKPFYVRYRLLLLVAALIVILLVAGLIFMKKRH